MISSSSGMVKLVVFNLMLIPSFKTPAPVEKCDLSKIDKTGAISSPDKSGGKF